MSPGPPAVATRELTKSCGQILGLVEPSGAGKRGRVRGEGP
jgi:hypothetical protein